MTIFTDDFERANGDPGGDWAACGAAMVILNGFVGYAATSSMCNTSISSTGRITSTVVVIQDPSTTKFGSPIVQAAPGSAVFYFARLTWSSDTYTFAIGKGALGTGNTLVSTTWSGDATNYHVLSLTYDNGTLSATCDGGHAITVQDAEYAARYYAGCASYASGYPIASVTIYDGADVALSVTPSVIGNYGSTTALTFTGTNTAWTSGTPGSPTFTCDHGTLSDQVVASATSATATYDPGNFLGTVTFTDPSTGQTDTCVVTSNPGIVNPSGQLSAAAIAYIERSAAAETNATILNRETEVGDSGETASAEIALGELRLSAYKSTWTVEGDPSTAALLYTLWRLVNGQKDPPIGPYPAANFDSLDAGLGLIKGDLDALMGESEWTLPDVLGYLGGDPFASHRDIMTALGSVEFDDTAILDAIAAAQGDPLATIKAVLDYLFALRTINEYTLGNVKTWVETVQGSGLPSIKDVADRLALIQPTTSNSLDDILTKTVGQTTLQSIVDLAVLALAGTEGATIAAVLDGISGLADLLNGLTVSVKAPPVWPGIDGVTLGDPVALASQLAIDEPMDGCLVDVTGVDGGVAFYTYGGVKAYRNVGALCFLTDQGDLEEWQLLGREHAIYTPKTMIRAAGLKLFTGHGLAGSVTPWTVSEE